MDILQAPASAGSPPSEELFDPSAVSGGMPPNVSTSAKTMSFDILRSEFGGYFRRILGKPVAVGIRPAKWRPIPNDSRSRKCVLGLSTEYVRMVNIRLN
jgi:hypothetical protein